MNYKCFDVKAGARGSGGHESDAGAAHGPLCRRRLDPLPPPIRVAPPCPKQPFRQARYPCANLGLMGEVAVPSWLDHPCGGLLACVLVYHPSDSRFHIRRKCHAPLCRRRLDPLPPFVWVHPTHYILHPKPYTLHPTPYTLSEQQTRNCEP